MVSRRLAGHLAVGTTYTIFGLNIVFCKDIANSEVISPEALFGIRMLVVTALFWLLSLILKSSEKVDRKDLPRIALAAMLGLVIPQYTFLKAITCATAIDTSIMSAFTPVVTMIMAAIFTGEPITGKKALGVGISLAGIMLLIFNSLHFAQSGGVSTTKGIILLLINSISFASYLGIFRPLIQKYNVVDFMKWMFLFSFIVSIPLSGPSLMKLDWASVPMSTGLEIAYLVVFATFVAYFLIPFGQQRLRPTVVSMYTYLQPIVAVAVSIFSGMDVLDYKKVAAILLVFTGVWLVNRSKSKHPEDGVKPQN